MPPKWGIIGHVDFKSMPVMIFRKVIENNDLLSTNTKTLGHYWFLLNLFLRKSQLITFSTRSSGT